MAAIGLLAGSPVAEAVRLGVTMTLLQVAIGATNDVVDAPRDVGRADKPIPTGRLAPQVGRAVAVAAGGAGLALAALGGPVLAALAVLVLAVGLVYDLRLKGTAWSWAPFAVGIPLIPVFAWAGAGAAFPAWFGVLLPAAVVAGAALAIGNALADLDRDEQSGTDSLPRRLGERRAWTLHGLLFALVALIALVTNLARGGSDAWTAVVVMGVGVVAAGAASLRAHALGRRQAGWALEAIGLAILAAGWVAGVSRG